MSQLWTIFVAACVLACPVSMLAMMWVMRRRHDAHGPRAEE